MADPINDLYLWDNRSFDRATPRRANARGHGTKAVTFMQDAPYALIPLLRPDGTVVGHTKVDVDKEEWVRLWTWRLTTNGYAKRGERRQGKVVNLGLHRELLGLVPGDGVQGDHKNRDRLDNRLVNLRICSHAQNCQNKPPGRGTSKYRGVTWDKGRWVAQAQLDGRLSVCLGAKMPDVEQQMRQLVAQLSLISHVGGSSYEGRMAKATDDDIGGRRPSGSDVDLPRRPHYPPKPDGLAEPEEWEAWEYECAPLRDAYEAELADWRVSYQRRTPAYFVAELEKCKTAGRLTELRDQAVETLAAWRRQPLVRGQEPDSMAHPQWKFYIAVEARTVDDVGRLARRYSCTRAHIYKVRKDYRLVA